MASQLSFFEVEPAMEMVQLAEEMLKDHVWMPGEVARLEAELAEAGEGVVASYGDPNAGIRAAYKNSDKTGGEVARRDRRWRRLMEMKQKIELFEKAIAEVEKNADYQESMLLDNLLSRVSVSEIAGKLRVSRMTAQKIKKKVVRKLAWALYELDPKRPTDGTAA